MKSLPVNVGSIKLRGKKHKLLSCGCCVCTDLREKYLKKQAEKEIRDWKYSIEA